MFEHDVATCAIARAVGVQGIGGGYFMAFPLLLVMNRSCGWSMLTAGDHLALPTQTLLLSDHCLVLQMY